MDARRKEEFLAMLKAQHQFPGAFTFKFIGKAAGDFPVRIAEAVRAALGLDRLPPFKAKPTSSGAHVSVTVIPHVKAAEDVFIVYAAVAQVEGLMVSL